MRINRRIYRWCARRMGNGQLVEVIMKVVTSLTLSQISEATDTSQACSEVLMSGKSTGITIEGKILEAAIQVDGHRYLLFVTDDVIFEELLTILLFDSAQGIVDAITIDHAYALGYLENLDVSADSVKFTSIWNLTWTVKTLTSPTLKLPFSDPPGVSHPLKLIKHIDISHQLSTSK